MICIWSDWQKVIYYEIIQNNQTVNVKLYRLKYVIQQKIPEGQSIFITPHANAGTHVANITKDGIIEQGWVVLL